MRPSKLMLDGHILPSFVRRQRSVRRRSVMLGFVERLTPGSTRCHRKWTKHLRWWIVLVGLIAFLAGAGVAHGRCQDHLPPLASEAGWPHIRGPHFNGCSTETGLVDQWPAKGPPVLWIKELGQGYSSFVVKDNRAYTQYQSLAGQYVICLNADTGETLWTYRYDWPFEATGLYPGPRSTPTIALNHIYFATPGGDVGCLDQQGKLIWRRALKQEFEGRGTGFGYSCSPTVIDDKVVMPVGGEGASMVALDARNGDVLWKSGSGSASYTPAFPINIEGRWIVIGYLEHELSAFDLETGNQLWTIALSRGYDEHSAWPIFDGTHLWVSAPFQAGSQLFRLFGGDSPGFERVWQSDEMSNDVSSSVLVDGHLFGFDLAEAQSKAHRPSRGSFKCMELLTGRTTWNNGDSRQRRGTGFEENKRSQTIGHASIVAADGKLLLLSDLGDLILARANSEQYQELARTPALPGEITWAAPALDRGRIFIRNHSRAVCIYVGDPDRLPSSGSIELSEIADVPQGRARDFSSMLGVEPEYAMDPPTRKWLRTWYVTGVAILVFSGVFTFLIGSFTSKGKRSKLRNLYWLLAFTLGIITGPVVSRWSGDFVFTWPVSLFVALAVTFQHAKPRQSAKRPSLDRWRDRAVILGFVLTCGIYLAVCRRLSLVTEWVFLCGFIGGLPVLLLGRSLFERAERRPVVAWLTHLAAFSAYYVVATLILEWKYELAAF